jgi:cytochrome c553
MGKWIRRLGVVVVVLVGAVALLYGAARWKAASQLATGYDIQDPPLAFAGDDAELARGAHLYTVLGCVECHGANAVGKVVFDAGPVATVVAPNLTPPRVADRYDADALAAAIRHGVGPDGRPLRFMPVGDFKELSDADTAALVRHLQTLPPSDNAPGEFRIGPVGYLLNLFGKFELVPAGTIDHAPRARTAPAEAPTAAYGAYLAQVCTGCHGAGWAGQRVPGTPPELPAAANLTPHADGLGAWTEADFIRAMREGRRPDDRELHPFMPWKVYGTMTDLELQAVWAHLSSLPPTADRAE